MASLQKGRPNGSIRRHIAVFAGDGVGTEVINEARKVIEEVATASGHQFEYNEMLMGGCAIDAYGTALRDEDLEQARSADAVLFGAVGGPKWDDPAAAIRPEQGILKIRKALGLYANLRPVATQPVLAHASPVKTEIIRGTDILVVRELTGGIYFGRPSRQWRERRGRVAVDTLVYREYEIERVVRLAFEQAMARKRRVTSVDKANVLSSSRLWRSVVTEVARDYPEVALEHMLIDAMTMKLIQQPSAYDVIVTENMFGDILTDEASVLGGSLGLLPSASLGAPGSGGRRPGLYEPIHGTAPDIAGQGKANPAGAILSAAMLLRISFGLEQEALSVERSVARALADGFLTADLGGTTSTTAFGDAVRERLSA
jgi:3-isopropylmalate dehydrogenase